MATQDPIVTTAAPNPLSAPPAVERLPRVTSAPASGSPPSSGTAAREEIRVVSRVLRVQLAPLPDAEWTALRALARDASRFCNAFLAQMYCAGTMDGEARTAMAKLAYRHASRVAGGRLSGDVAVALSREAWTTWRKQGARVLSGAQRLACFDADRALVCRAEHWSKGRRQIHARMLADADGYRLSVRFLAKRTGDRQEFAVVVPPVSDDYQRPVLEGFVDGRIRLLKI
ncbi:MAG TPA: hypothetical protein VH277_13010, partial [Gemmatimonadaceae bacterium]|nr:hypothetical protein [Gemmatimonadaceae bacterium]